MKETLKSMARFFTGEIIVFIAIILYDTVAKAINPTLGGHSFERGGIDGFMLGLYIAVAFCLFHTIIFLLVLLASKYASFLSFVAIPKFSYISGAIYGIAVLLGGFLSLRNMFIILVICPMAFFFVFILVSNVILKFKNV